eukprot:383463-Amphidinium_carterae.5
MKLNYNDENLITVAQELHAGVLYYMDLNEIEDVMKKAREDEDQEANRMLEIYQMDMNILETKLWKQLEDRDGRIDDNEDYITAFKDRDEEKMKVICYKYFEGHGELRQQWRKQKIDEDVRKENNIRKAIQQEEEEERQNRKRERDEQEASTAAASSTPKAKPTALPAASAAAITEPQRPTREPPIPPSQRELENTMEYKKVPATPSVPVLSPRLRLERQRGRTSR